MRAGTEACTSIPVLFDVTILPIATDPARAERLLDAAVASLAGPMPAASETCEYCLFSLGRFTAGIHHQPVAVAAAPAA